MEALITDCWSGQPRRPNGNVELLIGADFTRALEPIEVIRSKNDGPFPIKAVFGWCIVGSLSCSNHINGKFLCIKAAVQYTRANKIGSHYFVMEDKVKENVDIKAML